MPKRQTIHLVANAHLDPVWLWRWPEGCSELRATCRAAVTFLESDSELAFSRSSAGDMRWLVDLEPRLVARIRRLVRAGRWENVGGWWTQPDCNIPSGESFVRQGLYGQRFFRDRLGAPSRVGYNVDSFGHHGNLPQLLAQSGMPFYVFMRPGPDENPAIPQGYFWWEGVDGTRVLAFHVFDPYNADGAWGLPGASLACRRHMAETGVRSSMLFFGVGDHGGGITHRSLEAIEEMRAERATPSFVFSTPGRAFDALTAAEKRRLPVFRGELQHHASGCYSAHLEIKRLNRRAEEALLAAERLSVAARTWTRRPYPAAALCSAWQDLLFNQFHDVLAGSSVRAAYVDARDQMGRAIFTAEEAADAARQSVAARVDTRGPGQAVILFNPHTIPFDGLFETENVSQGLFHWQVNPQQARLCDAAGRAADVQFVAPTAMSGGLCRMLMRLQLPALGYRVYWFRPCEEAPAPPPSSIRVGDAWMSNGALRVSVARDGIRIRDLARRRDVLRRPGLRALVMDDPGDTWGHDCLKYDRCIGSFELAGVRTIESGPLRACLRAEYAYGRSRLWLDVLLEDGRRAVEFRAKLWWLEARKLLKICFPVAAKIRAATHEIPYAALRRPANGDEEPMQQWVDVGNGRAGASLVNDGLYSVSVEGSEIRQTVVRSTPYAWSRCKAYPWPGENVDWRDEDWCQDQGIHEFRLLLVPHDGDWRRARTPDQARLFNHPPSMQAESTHPGRLRAEASFLRVAGEGVQVSVLKQAEEGRDTILRAVDVTGHGASASIAIPALGVRARIRLRPWQIATFRVGKGGLRPEPMLERYSNER